jgi:hypothetical protein
MKHLIYLLLIAATCFIGCKDSEPKLKNLNTIHVVVGDDTVKISRQFIDLSSVRCSSGHNDWDKGITTITICTDSQSKNKNQ